VLVQHRVAGDVHRMAIGSEHATITIACIIFITTGAILFNIFRASRGKELFIRRIPGISAVDEAIGRSTEMGRPILFSPGLYPVQYMNTLAALSVLQYIARFAAKFGTRLLVSVCDPTTYPVAEEIVHEAYEAEGKIEDFRAEDVRFLAGGQFAWAMATMGLMLRENAGSCFYFGESQAESLMLAETGYLAGALQVAATDALYQMPFYIAACDYCIFGEEYYAVTAYLSREPVMTGSLIGQDISKLVIAAIILAGVIYTTVATIFPRLDSGWFVRLLQR
jgi:hypothetical protein